MPKPTPEVQQAQATFKAAQQALQAATFAQWEQGGVPLGPRFVATLLGVAMGLALSLPLITAWSDHLFQQQWAAKVQQNPRLSHLPGPHRVGSGPFLILFLPLAWAIPFIKQGKTLSQYTNTRRTLTFSVCFGILLAIVGAYLLSRPLLSFFNSYSN